MGAEDKIMLMNFKMEQDRLENRLFPQTILPHFTSRPASHDPFCPKDSGRNRATDEKLTDRHLANENAHDPIVGKLLVDDSAHRRSGMYSIIRMSCKICPVCTTCDRSKCKQTTLVYKNLVLYKNYKNNCWKTKLINEIAVIILLKQNLDLDSIGFSINYFLNFIWSLPG